LIRRAEGLIGEEKETLGEKTWELDKEVKSMWIKEAAVISNQDDIVVRKEKKTNRRRRKKKEMNYKHRGST